MTEKKQYKFFGRYFEFTLHKGDSTENAKVIRISSRKITAFDVNKLLRIHQQPFELSFH